MDILYAILEFCGGIGAFLFGVKVMSNGLQAVAGKSIQDKVHKFAHNKYAGAGFGFGITVLFQSSTATTTLAVSMVSAGLLTLGEAVPIIFGSNLGTVVTQAIVSFNIIKLTTVFAGLTGVLAIIYASVKSERVKRIVYPFIGFCLMFVGCGLMGNDFITGFIGDLIVNVDLGFFSGIALFGFGFVLAVVLQSSLSAVIVLIGVYGATTAISLTSIAYVLMGVNVGTTLTALLAAIGGRRDSLRAGVAHLLYSVLGSILFFALMPTGWLNLLENIDKGFQIVMFNVVFNTVMLIILLPLSGAYTKMLKRIVRTKPSKYIDKYAIPPDVMDFPQVAMNTLQKQTVSLYKEFYNMFKGEIISFESNELRIENFKKLKEKFEENIDKVLANGTEIYARLDGADAAEMNLVNDRLADLKYISGYAARAFRFSYNLKKTKLDEAIAARFEGYFTRVIDFMEKCLSVINGDISADSDHIFEWQTELDNEKRVIQLAHIKLIKEGSRKTDFVLLGDTLNNIESIYSKYGIFATIKTRKYEQIIADTNS
ncbi:MAG: Na/Pi symporter [Christensenellaceae bacterium]|jgi:phosphate:Na+ symporter|nr:Na/Pi symporter [Christensenellaceae bacterium]